MDGQTLELLAEMICGDGVKGDSAFKVFSPIGTLFFHKSIIIEIFRVTIYN